MAKRHPRVTRGLGVSDEPPICMTVGNDQSISWMRHQPPHAGHGQKSEK